MNQLVECIPNISEGRDSEKIDKIVHAVESTSNVWMLDLHVDSDHNRSVLTFVGDPESMQNAVLNLFDKAINLIDLRVHKGEHPRMGAVDVVPFVPIENIAMDQCVEISKQVGNEIWQRFKIPVYLYEYSAKQPERSNLADIRRGEFEGFFEKITHSKWAPDIGEARVNPTAGVVAVGARMPLIAYNVNLNTSDLSAAKSIAKKFRESSGGLRFVKALGFPLESRGIVQVSMNLTNYKETSMYDVFNAIEHEADEMGIQISGSEIVGLVPRDALDAGELDVLRLEDFNESQILEERIEHAISQS